MDINRAGKADKYEDNPSVGNDQDDSISSNSQGPMKALNKPVTSHESVKELSEREVEVMNKAKNLFEKATNDSIDIRCRLEAAEELCSMIGYESEAADAWLSLIDTPQCPFQEKLYTLVNRVMPLIGQEGKAIDAILDIIQDTNLDTVGRMQAIEVIFQYVIQDGKAGDRESKISTALLEVIKDSEIDINYRFNITNLLFSTGKYNEQVSQACTSLIDTGIRSVPNGLLNVASMLGNIPGSEDRAGDLFLEVLNNDKTSKDNKVRIPQLLISLDGQEQKAAKACSELLNNIASYQGYLDVSSTIKVWSQIPGEDDNAASALMSIVDNSALDISEKIRLLTLLSKINGNAENASKRLLALAESEKDQFYKLSIVLALIEVDNLGQDAVKVLVDLLSSRSRLDPMHTQSIIEALSAIPGQENNAADAWIKFSERGDISLNEKRTALFKASKGEGFKEKSITALERLLQSNISTFDRAGILTILSHLREEGEMHFFRVIEKFLPKMTESHFAPVLEPSNFDIIPAEEKEAIQKLLLSKMRQDLPSENNSSIKNEKEIASKLVIMWFSEDSNERMEAIMVLASFDSRKDSAYSLFSTIAEKRKEEVSVDFPSFVISDGESEYSAAFTSQALKNERFEWREEYASIKWDKVEAEIKTYIDLLNSVDRSDQKIGYSPYIESIAERPYIIEKINASSEGSEIGNKVKSIISGSLEKMRLHSLELEKVKSNLEIKSEERNLIVGNAGNALSFLFNFNDNIQTCKGGIQEAITVTSQGIKHAGGGSSDEVLLREKIDGILQSSRNIIMLGHEDQLGLGQGVTFASLLPNVHNYNTHTGLAAAAIAGGELGLNSVPAYDEHGETASEFILNTSKKEIINAFMDSYTPSRMLPVLTKELNEIFASKLKVDATDGQSYLQMDYKWNDTITGLTGVRFNPEGDTSGLYKTVTVADADVDEEYEYPVGLSSKGVLHLLDKLGYVNLEAKEVSK